MAAKWSKPGQYSIFHGRNLIIHEIFLLQSFRSATFFRLLFMRGKGYFFVSERERYSWRNVSNKTLLEWYPFCDLLRFPVTHIKFKAGRYYVVSLKWNRFSFRYQNKKFTKISSYITVFRKTLLLIQ